MILFLLEERECLAVLIEAGLDASSLFGIKGRAALEVNAEAGTVLVLTSDGSVVGPVLVVFQEGTLELGRGNLNCANRLEGINV